MTSQILLGAKQKCPSRYAPDGLHLFWLKSDGGPTNAH